MKIRNKIISFILCTAIIFSAGIFVPRAQAQWITSDPLNTVQNTLTNISTAGSLSQQLGEWVKAQIESQLVTAAKIAALLAVQATVAHFIGDGDGLMIRDYGNYLYTAPRQRAMTQMNNTFLKTLSGGRTSNYEGVGPKNYPLYIASQVKQSLSDKQPKTTMQNQVSDPDKMFAGGNMKGIMAYIECGNNVPCATLAANAAYEKEFSKQQDVARSEQQNGLLPKKDATGRIFSPAFIAQNALMQVDQIGTQLIMNAGPGQETADALIQIVEGATISTTSRIANYNISDTNGQSAITTQNGQFPFSLAYTFSGKLGSSPATTTANNGNR
jgi:hypothetical protein